MAEAQQVSDTAKSCGEMGKIGRERAPQLSRQIPQMRAGDLPPDMRPQILALKVAEASKPIAVRAAASASSWCAAGRTRNRPADARRGQRQIIARERYDTLARRYLRDLRRSAYVDIRG